MAKSAPADMSMMYAIHAAFRRDLGRLAVAVAALPDGESERAAELAERWGFVSEVLHHHHQGEDAHLWPLVRRKAPGSGALLDAMVEEHAQIDPLLATVGRGFARLTAGDDAAREPLAADLGALLRTLGAHLDHEEREAVPVVEQNVTAAELKAFSHSQRKSMKLSQVTTFFPWVLDGMDDDARRSLLQEFPPPLRLLTQRRWVPRYERQGAALWG